MIVGKPECSYATHWVLIDAGSRASGAAAAFLPYRLQVLIRTTGYGRFISLAFRILEAAWAIWVTSGRWSGCTLMSQRNLQPGKITGEPLSNLRIMSSRIPGR